MNARIERSSEFIEKLTDLSNCRANFNLVVAPYESPIEQYKDMFYGWGDKPKVTIVAKDKAGGLKSLKAVLLRIQVLRARDISRFQLKGCVGIQHPKGIITDLDRSVFNSIAWQPVVLDENSFVLLLELEGIPVGQPV